MAVGNCLVLTNWQVFPTKHKQQRNPWLTAALTETALADPCLRNTVLKPAEQSILLRSHGTASKIAQIRSGHTPIQRKRNPERDDKHCWRVSRSLKSEETFIENSQNHNTVILTVCKEKLRVLRVKFVALSAYIKNQTLQRDLKQLKDIP